MGVPMKQNIPLLHGWKVILMINVAMCGIDGDSINRQQRIVRHHRKFQHHLVHLRITVAPDTVDPVFAAV